MCGSAAATAGLNRSEWPTAQTTPRRAAASTMRVASATEEASGFSTSTAAPASMQPSAISACDSVGTAIVTASTRPQTSRQSLCPAVP